LLLLDRFGFRQLEIVFLLFISVEAIALGINFFEASIPVIPLIEGLVIPQLSSRTLPVAVGALGALVMPYNLFFQSAVVNSRPRDRQGGDAQMALLCSYMQLENLVMLILAFGINVFVVCVFADGFYDPNLPPVEIGLESAGEHLAERFGTPFKYAWAVGLLCSGQVATITLTYAGQLVMTGLLNIKVNAGSRMMATRLVALIPTVVMAVVFEASQTFDYAAQLLNVAQSVLLPFALLPVLRMTADRDIMGERFVSSRWLTVTGSIICSVILIINGYLIFDVFRVSFGVQGSSAKILALAVLASAIMVCYYLLALYFAIGPDKCEEWLLRRRGTSSFNQETVPLVPSREEEAREERSIMP
jgi:Mn2+/Fe2+ NRAMP family transporter